MKNNLEKNMTEPTKEQIDKWRSDFEKEFEIDDISIDYFKREGSYGSFSEDDKWQGYLAAKKSDFEEIKTLKEQLAESVKLAKLGVCSVDGLLTHNNESWELSAESWIFKTKIFLEKQDKENKDKK